MNKGLIIGGAVVLVVVAFIAGAFLGAKIPFVANISGTATARQLPGGAGGPMANLSDDDRAKLQNMTDAERQQFFQEKMGSDAPAGQPGAGRGRGGMSLDGELIDVGADSFTLKTSDGGSQTIYYNSDTTIAYAKGVDQTDLAQGDAVVVVAQPTADNVVTATAILVK